MSRHASRKAKTKPQAARPAPAPAAPDPPPRRPPRQVWLLTTAVVLELAWLACLAAMAVAR